MQHLREGVDSQVRWWRIHILLVGAVVTGTDRLSIYPFTGVPLAFSSFLFLRDFVKIYIFYSFIIFSFLFCFFKLFIDFFFVLSFFLSYFKFSFILFSFIPTYFSSLSLLISFPLSFSPHELFIIWVCVLVMSIDSKFVFEFIVWVMVIMVVHSTCQKCIHVRATCRTWVNDFQRHAWECPLSCISSLFSLKLTGSCVYWLYGPGTHCHP